MSKKDDNFKKGANPSKGAAQNASAANNGEEPMKLDDARRVKVLSPSMLVIKRFLRNRLAIVGMSILVFMFLFAFLGGALSPYKPGDTFFTTAPRQKEYAVATHSKNLIFVPADGESIGNDNAEIINGIKMGLEYTTGRYSSPQGTIYKIENVHDDLNTIYRMTPVVEIESMGSSLPGEAAQLQYKDVSEGKGGFVLDDAFKTAYEAYAAAPSGEYFNYNGVEYIVEKASKLKTVIKMPILVAMSTYFIYDQYATEFIDTINDFDFKFNFENALAAEEDTFSLDGVDYKIYADPAFVFEPHVGVDATIVDDVQFRNAIIAALNSESESVSYGDSTYTLAYAEYKFSAHENAANPEICENLDFMAAATECVDSGKTSFTFEGVEYTAAYNETRDVYDVKADGKDFCTMKYVDAHELVLDDEPLVLVSNWEAFRVARIDDAGETDFAYVSTFSVKEHASREGLILPIDYKLAARDACATLTTTTGGRFKYFNHDSWVKDVEVMISLTDDDGTYVTSVAGDKYYIDPETVALTDEGGTYIMYAAEEGAEAEKVYVQTSIVAEPANEGDEGAYLDSVEYQVEYGSDQYMIRTETEILVMDLNGAPTADHWLGTDPGGRDTFTLLMSGGRISLMVGFVVIFIELIIGVIVGGISGYFGGVVDTICMRFVDLFNCIPYWPMMLIGGSLMDAYQLSGTARIFCLVGILGILSWTGIARIVRGQILSLREQDFMIATEACGIKVRRRIFRHLVPNVMPLLIVQATMGLGSIIISEATLSYLGLGVKYPDASWGTIINSIQTPYQMTTYWYVWIPAGLCIMLSVLGFNFVGDGLRDAFDPKMKR